MNDLTISALILAWHLGACGFWVIWSIENESEFRPLPAWFVLAMAMVWPVVIVVNIVTAAHDKWRQP